MIPYCGRVLLFRACFALALLGGSAGGCAKRGDSTSLPGFHADRIEHIAVAVENHSGEDVPMTWIRQVEDQFVVELGRRGYKVAQRSGSGTLLDEDKLDEAGLTGHPSAEPVSGRQNRPVLRRTEHVFAVYITEFDYDAGRGSIFEKKPFDGPDFRARCAISARLVRRSDGETLWTGRYRHRNSVWKSLAAGDMLAETADVVAGRFPRR